MSAVIFDWDGVIIDSHDAHRQSWFELADELGRKLTDAQFKESFGMRNAAVIPDLFGWAAADDACAIHELGERKEQLYRSVLRATGIEPLPGVTGLLDSLDAYGIPFGIGSSTSHENIRTTLELCGLTGRFQNVTAAEDVSRGKPDPEVFLCAASSLGFEPGRCVVIEDAHVGITAARAAGMKCVAVTTTHPRGSFGSQPDRIVDSLAELSADDIVALTRPSAD